MLTVKHITPEGETTFGVERVVFDKARNTVFADQMPITTGRVFVMNDKGATVAKYELDPSR